MEPGIKVNKYFASEIDKHAIKVTQCNYPNTIQVGDVCGLRYENGALFHHQNDNPLKNGGSYIVDIDLVIGGSPCQGFSFAGKQLNFKDPRSKLFFEFVRVLEETKPKYFLLENVKMKKEHEHIISRYMGVEPIVINSALLSAQNRVRLYWTNIANKPHGLYNHMRCMIPQPKDKNIFIKDILENDVSKKYFITSKTKLKFITDEWRQNKKYTQIDGQKAITQLERQYANWGGDYITVASRERDVATLTHRRTEYGKQIRKEYEAGKIKEQRKNIQQLEPRHDGKTNCLTSVQKDNLLLHNKEQKIRRLTPIECERLQTVPDNYTSCVSDTQRYKMLGNGWTVDVIKYIFSFMDLTKSKENDFNKVIDKN